MNRMKIAGIDYSLTSPAVCIYTEENDGGYFDFGRCVLHYLSNTKGQQQLAAGCGLDNIKASPYPEWETEEERHENLSDWAYKLIQGCKEVFIEGYAFATVGKSHVRSVAEGTGLLKNKMWKMKVPFTIFPANSPRFFALLTAILGKTKDVYKAHLLYSSLLVLLNACLNSNSSFL